MVRQRMARVDAGQEPHEMETGAALGNVSNSIEEGRVFEKRSIADRIADTDSILFDHAPCADIKVPRFRVADLIFW